MIVTLTMNPAVDKTILVPRLEAGQVHRVRESQLDPAGKGINVSRLVDRLKWPTIAFGFLAGEVGLLVERTLAEEGVPSHFLRVLGQTRLNVTVFDEELGQGTSFYDQGPWVAPERLQALQRDLEPWLKATKLFVLAGSLSPGIPDGAYAELIRLARSAGVRPILDAAGEPLRLGVAAGPYLVKPNVQEAEELLGRPLRDVPAVIAAAREIAGLGVEVALISMGARGAVAASGAQTWLAVPPTVERRSTVGSGDSMVAGLAVALAGDGTLVDALRLGTAAGAATAMVPGTALGSPEDIAELLPRVRVEELA